MASSSLRIFAKTMGRTALKKFLSLKKEREWFRFYSSLLCSKQFVKMSEVPERCFCDSNIVKSTYPEFKISEMPLHEFVFKNIGNWENKVAVECGATGKKLTYKELRKWSKANAAALQKKFNLVKGEIQAVVLPNCPEYPAILLAGSMSGAVTTTINPIYTPTEISLQLKICKPKILYTVPDVYGKCVEALNLLNMKIPIVIVRNHPDQDIPAGAVSYTELCEFQGEPSPVSIDINDDLVLPFSSGTSGLPKGVQLSHKNIIANLMQFANGNELKSNPDKETNQSSILGVLPMFHIYGMVLVTLDTITEGARLVSLPRFEPKLFIETIYNKKLQILYLVPPLIFFLGTNPTVESHYLKHVQHIVSGAAPCGESDLVKLMKKIENVDVSQGYGMTETSPVVTVSHRDRFHKLSSAGHPLPLTAIKVADINNGKPLPVGSRGEICIKGPQVMKGYLNMPEETKNTFDKDGWLRTGDIGFYDEDFDFYIVDRMKELIKVKGYQVAPAELEEFLRNHPKIADAGVIGISHPEFGQVPRAYITLKKEASATEEEIQEYIKGRLSSYKHLTGGVEFLKEIPKSSAGKILRKELKKLHENS